jgi:hypothetical protein
MDERRWERLGAVLGLVLVVVVIVAVFLTGSPPKPSDGDAAVKAYLVDKRGAYLAQAVMIAIGLGLFAWFVAVVRGVLHRAGGEMHMVDVFYGAALISIAVMLVAGALTIGLVYKALPGTNEGTARMVFDMSGAMFTLAGAVWAVGAFAFAAVVMATKALPRWTAWMAEAWGVTSLASIFMVLSKTGGFSLEGWFAFVPFALSMVWVLGTSIALLRPEMAHAPSHAASPA